MNKKRKIFIRSIIVLFVVVVWFAYCGYAWNWGPFNNIHNIKINNLPGNQEEFSVSHTDKLPVNILEGKKICFLGSSITYGALSMGESFADFLEKRDGIISIKEAVSGTTLVDKGTDSYISRMKTLDSQMELDLFVCQLSTNDATKKEKLGNVSESTNMEDFDILTITGAIEYIIAYAEATWNCPVVIYTNPQYNSDAYNNMVTRLIELQDKWDVGVIDMWNDLEFNDISKEERKLYMVDSIHPTKAGYREWWTVYMENYLLDYFNKKIE